MDQATLPFSIDNDKACKKKYTENVWLIPVASGP